MNLKYKLNSDINLQLWEKSQNRILNFFLTIPSLQLKIPNIFSKDLFLKIAREKLKLWDKKRIKYFLYPLVLISFQINHSV